MIKPTEAAPLFTYKNPFEALNASRKATPNPTTAAQIAPSVATVESIERSYSPNPGLAEGQQEGDLPMHFRRKLTPKVPKRNSSHGLQSSPIPGSPVHTETAEPFPRIENLPLAPATHTTEAIPDESTHDNIKPEVEDDLSVDKTLPRNQNGVAEHADTREDNTDPADVWEDAEDSPKESTSRDVPVYSFPIKPFVSITLKPLPPSEVGIRDGGVMEISRLKKEFDQLDRTLAVATSKYISYALKNGGIRVIRQDDGSDRSVFKNSHDRCFNISLCTTAVNSGPSNEQAVLGTGLSGAVYYATVSKESNDLFEDDLLDSESIVFPAYPPGDENTSGGVLKTRAKKSSRHPEFFGLGRGKSIHLVWPATAMVSRYGVTGGNKIVDVEKLFLERSLKITTGKAGKDFTFSEDDTLIASLDKSGRLRFWDIRSLIDPENAVAAQVEPVEIDAPLLSLATASPAEKSWPTSVVFLDKSRPYAKNTALRYVLIGLKQNHTLQLWDIALGKAVQELNFPHEAESDGICSVAYHPASGIIVVGHPTRNSIYFIHLSAPRYALQPMSQALYVHRLAAKDPDLPRPDATACMSGIREMSFASKGHLRSLELLPIQKSTDSTKSVPDGSPLFELYAVHSKGVTCLSITKDDLGLTFENKAISSFNAIDAGIVTTKELKLGSIIDEAAEEQSSTTKSMRKKSTKKSLSDEALMNVSTDDAPIPLIELPPDDSANDTRTIDAASAQIPLTKKAKKKAAAAAAAAAAKDQEIPVRDGSPAKPVISDPIPREKPVPRAENTTGNNGMPQPPAQIDGASSNSKADIVTVGISGDWLDKELKKIEKGVASEFKKGLDGLFRHIQNDRSVQDSAAVARQEAVLRLVSTMLSTNIEQTLSQMITTQMERVVVPALRSVTIPAVTAQVQEAVAKTLQPRISESLEIHLPSALNSAMLNPGFQRNVSDAVSQKISSQVGNNLGMMLANTITPSFKALAVSAAEKAAAEVEVHLANHIRQREAERVKDNQKIDDLNKVLVGIASTMEAMSQSQVAFQGQILKDRGNRPLMSDGGSDGSARRVPTHHQLPAPTVTPPPVQLSAEEIEDEEIGRLMLDANYEAGAIRWLQSPRQADLFDRIFVRYTPDFLVTDVSPLVAFSVAITVGSAFSTNVSRRLAWIDAAFRAVDFDVSYPTVFHQESRTNSKQDPELADLSQHAPGLLTSLVQKLEALFMQTSERDPASLILREIQPVAKRARDMIAEVQEAHPQEHRLRYR
jgi:WD40 repeat protein